MSTPEMIQEEDARSRADAYLRERHFKYEKIIFQSSELAESDGRIIYRFRGLLIEKPVSLIDMLARNRKNTTYKFVIDVNSTNGRVLTYQLT